MSEMGAADFKAHCLQVMEKVGRTRRPVTITKRGVPFVKVVPVEAPAAFVLGALEGRFASAGDIVSSPLSDRQWKAREREQAAQWERWMKEPPPPRASRRRRAR